jgi:hypothetical protein
MYRLVELLAHQRRKLVAERLAGAGRHHQQGVAPAQRSLDRLLLAGAIGGAAEMPPQGVVEVGLAATDDSGGSGAEISADSARRACQPDRPPLVSMITSLMITKRPIMKGRSL